MTTAPGGTHGRKAETKPKPGTRPPPPRCRHHASAATVSASGSARCPTRSRGAADPMSTASRRAEAAAPLHAYIARLSATCHRRRPRAGRNSTPSAAELARFCSPPPLPGFEPRDSGRWQARARVYAGCCQIRGTGTYMKRCLGSVRRRSGSAGGWRPRSHGCPGGATAVHGPAHGPAPPLLR